MPQLEVTGLVHKAVLWEKAATDKFGADTVYLPVEIDCRWNEDERDIQDRLKNTVRISGDAMVAREIPVGSIMWLGELADLPTPLTNLRRVYSYDVTLNIKNRISQRNVLLQRHANELPTLAGSAP